jgi:putative transposase
VFSNHYHFVAQSPSAGSGAESLQDVLQQLHRISATWVNRLDGTPSRRVWHNYWDSHLTFEKSYMARLHYVHENAAHHGLVSDARIYPYSSALWFENTASEATRRAIQSFKIDRISVVDGYDVHPDWQAG